MTPFQPYTSDDVVYRRPDYMLLRYIATRLQQEIGGLLIKNQDKTYRLRVSDNVSIRFGVFAHRLAQSIHLSMECKDLYGIPGYVYRHHRFDINSTLGRDKWDEDETIQAKIAFWVRFIRDEGSCNNFFTVSGENDQLTGSQYHRSEWHKPSRLLNYLENIYDTSNIRIVVKYNELFQTYYLVDNGKVVLSSDPYVKGKGEQFRTEMNRQCIDYIRSHCKPLSIDQVMVNALCVMNNRDEYYRFENEVYLKVTQPYRVRGSILERCEDGTYQLTVIYPNTGYKPNIRATNLITSMTNDHIELRLDIDFEDTPLTIDEKLSCEVFELLTQYKSSLKSRKNILAVKQRAKEKQLTSTQL